MRKPCGVRKCPFTLFSMALTAWHSAIMWVGNWRNLRYSATAASTTWLTPQCMVMIWQNAGWPDGRNSAPSPAVAADGPTMEAMLRTSGLVLDQGLPLRSGTRAAFMYDQAMSSLPSAMTAMVGAAVM
jgi:hypothetical protein